MELSGYQYYKLTKLQTRKLFYLYYMHYYVSVYFYELIWQQVLLADFVVASLISRPL